MATRNGVGTKEHIAEIPTVWVDIDFKHVPQDHAKRAVWEFPQRPSLLIESGGGYHIYWRLKESATKDDIAQVEALNRQLAEYLGGDMGATDASRILRLPETFNQKYDPPRPVKVIWQNTFDYNLDDLAAAAPRLAGAPSKEHPYKFKDSTFIINNALYKGSNKKATFSNICSGRKFHHRAP